MKTETHSRLIRRYTPAERANHWLTAITFILLAFSGLALFHPSMFWFTQFFGGPVWTRILHPYIGVVMFLSFAGLALKFWHHNLISRNDVEWLKRIGDVIRNREDRLPERALSGDLGDVANVLLPQRRGGGGAEARQDRL